MLFQYLFIQLKMEDFMKKILSLFLMLFCAIPLLAGDIPPNTGIQAVDCISGKTFDFDMLLKTKHIVVHQTFSG